MDARSVVSNEDDDKRSVASTTATTASLASRIQSLAVDFGPKAHEGITEGFAEEEIEEENEAESEDEEVIEVTEEHLLQELDRQEPAFQVCSRLFKDIRGTSTTLKRLTSEQAESFHQNGYVVVDNFLPHEHAVWIRSEALAFKGRFQEACNVGMERSSDRSARGDYTLWLHANTPPATTPSFTVLFAALKELQEDLAQLVRLRHRTPEHQLSYYPANGSQYVRHRDAFPDNGSEKGQRRVTAIVYANPGWRREDGGKLRMWPPNTDSSSNAGMCGNSVAPLVNGQTHLLPNGHCATIDSQQPQQAMAELSAGYALAGTRQGRAAPYGAALNGETHADNVGCHNSLHSSPVRLQSHGSATSEGILPGPRSPRSIGSSVVAEPTDASSLPDNASVDGASVRSSGRSEHVANGRTSVEEVGTAAVVDVAPIAGRLVLFLSGAVEHAVLPNFADRLAITCWCQ